MPIIKCNDEWVYARPVENFYGDVVKYIVPGKPECDATPESAIVHVFPDVVVQFNDVFTHILSELTGEPLNKIEHYDDPAREFAEYLVEKLGLPAYAVAHWDYTINGQQYNDELIERIAEKMTPYINEGYQIIEIVEPDEGDSIFLPAKPEQTAKILRKLNKYIRQTYIVNENI